jgi:hypothetical protein
VDGPALAGYTVGSAPWGRVPRELTRAVYAGGGNYLRLIKARPHPLLGQGGRGSVERERGDDFVILGAVLARMRRLEGLGPPRCGLKDGRYPHLRRAPPLRGVQGGKGVRPCGGGPARGRLN